MKYMTAEVKALSGDGPGAFEAVASAPTLDRDGEIVAKGAFNPLPASLPVHVDHQWSADGLVGSARPFYSGDNLLVRGTFAGTARAQEVRQLVTGLQAARSASTRTGELHPPRRALPGSADHLPDAP
jgi:hypothetical protein